MWSNYYGDTNIYIYILWAVQCYNVIILYVTRRTYSSPLPVCLSTRAYLYSATWFRCSPAAFLERFVSAFTSSFFPKYAMLSFTFLLEMLTKGPPAHHAVCRLCQCSNTDCMCLIYPLWRCAVRIRCKNQQ